GISVDSRFSNKRYAEDLGLTYPLLSDFQREVSELYGILNTEHGFANRTTFVVDMEGTIQHIDEGRDAIDVTKAYEVCERLAG
ncbi:MAG: redoxin domain-containing protein, partial [Acidobacteria bacterium]|nr:redoxin domain-containing protein [Acidobacteriota bacterium]